MTHTHGCYELVYFFKGRGVVHANGQTFYYKTNDAVIVPPDMPHDETGEISEQNIVIGFKIFSEPEDGRLCEKLCGEFFTDERMQKLLQKILREYLLRDVYFKEIAEARLCELICLLLREKQLEKTKNEDFSEIIKNFENYVDENLSLQIKIGDFSKIYSYSESRFRHIFTEKTGVSPKKLIMQKRFEKAEDLLLKTQKSVIEIALDCGFYDSAQFARLFKIKNGCPPKRFRENRLKE